MVTVVLPTPSTLALFAAASLALLLVPGPAVLYVVTQSATLGRRVGVASVLGIHLGTLVHVAAAAAGLSAVIVASATAFTAVKYAGAAYLVYLGVRKFLERTPPEVAASRSHARRAFVRGILVNILNP